MTWNDLVDQAWHDTVDRYLRGDISAGEQLVGNQNFFRIVENLARRRFTRDWEDARNEAMVWVLKKIRACKFNRAYCSSRLRLLDCHVLSNQPEGFDQITHIPLQLQNRFVLNLLPPPLYLCFDPSVSTISGQVIQHGDFLNAMLDLIQQDYADRLDLCPAFGLAKWMTVVARNHIKTLSRHEQRLIIVNQSPEEFQIPDDQDDLEIIESQILVAQIQTIIQKLDQAEPQQGYRIWAQRKMEGMEDQDIARELNISPVEMSRRKKTLLIHLSAALGYISEAQKLNLLKRRRTIRSREIWGD